MFKKVSFDFANDRDDHYTAFMVDDALGAIQIPLQHNLSAGSGYGSVISFYKSNNKPLAKNIALMLRYYYGTGSINCINTFVDFVHEFYPNLVSKEVIDCTRRHLHDLLRCS